MTNGITVVLGWDGLDYELLDRFGLMEGFGAHTSRMETFSNPIIDEPHTRELWPTMITGVKPEEHGIKAATEDGSLKWQNPGLRIAASIGHKFVPKPVLTKIGRWLRSRGHEVEKYDSDYYQSEGLETVFDGRQSLEIAVPNFWTPLDEEMGFMFDRGAELGEWLDRGPDGWKPATRAQQMKVEQQMWSEAGKKMGLIESGLEREYDLIWMWDGMVDTAGHVEPVVADPIQERAYRQALRFTELIRGSLATEDTLICVSDHGLRNGSHTHDAVISSDDPEVIDQVESVFDLKQAIESVTKSSDSSDHPGIRSHAEAKRASESTDAGEIKDRLEALGYMD